MIPIRFRHRLHRSRAHLLVALAAVTTASVALVDPVPSADAAMTVTAGTAPAFSAQGTAHATAAPATAQMIDGQVTLSVDSLAPEIITSGQDLNISGTIANGTDEPLKGLSLTARVQDSTELTVTGLESWLASERDSATRAIDLGVLDSSIAPGAVQTFSLTVAADDLSLGQEDQWGPRGMEVTASQGRNAVAQDRTLLVWDTGEKAARSRVTALIPVTASAEDLTLLTTGAEPPTDAQLADLRRRITSLLALAGDGVVLAVDPALLEALGVTEEPPSAATPSASASPSANDTGNADGGEASPVPSASAGPPTDSPSAAPSTPSAPRPRPSRRRRPRPAPPPTPAARSSRR